MAAVSRSVGQAGHLTLAVEEDRMSTARPLSPKEQEEQKLRQTEEREQAAQSLFGRLVPHSKDGGLVTIEWLMGPDGQRTLATIVKWITLGASDNAVAQVVGIPKYWWSRWKTQGNRDLVRGEWSETAQFVVAIESARNQPRVLTEMELRNTNPLAWLRFMHKSRPLDSGWSDQMVMRAEDQPIVEESEEDTGGPVEGISYGDVPKEDALVDCLLVMEEMGLVQPNERTEHTKSLAAETNDQPGDQTDQPGTIDAEFDDFNDDDEGDDL